MTILNVGNVSVEYTTKGGSIDAVSDVGFELEKGETLALVGESGSGKTTLGKAVLNLLDENGEISEGEIRYDGRNITGLSDKEMREIRWQELSLIPQNAMNSLDPVYRVGSLFKQVYDAHIDISKAEARERTSELLESVGLDANRMHDYPHELSGGQRQRVTIALSLALDPSLIVADECTTGLDVVVQDEILELISDLQEDIGNAMIFITHDISAVAEVADKVAVMYAGQIVEYGDIENVFKHSTHPYTIGLRQAVPTIHAGEQQLSSIPGEPPDLSNPPSGCRFLDRCPFATTECKTEPSLRAVQDEHESKCHYNDRAKQFRADGENPETWLNVTSENAEVTSMEDNNE